ncbi:MAG: AbrB/MazE/SpoVT family DNA-binding domain-containing protein [Thaumarchaeota archaeon]|nr:MAG: AbrB family transcriptional regulator [Thaumarchaeota archaeon 13_1_40CM_4_38_7]OLC92142.1 MAG: AbrB family transcriptional regulator [Thaumarchaeota archaeon 13_1_40CM_3_38_6]TLY05277.1 MAG: AbrB/MazE/SpoVT family DNA-binding domain-containing protein [Nitrososphaerota archaeon]TLY08655.1 MAG: AbrB/MazE/SpoVT family DNA-binding domain-containing protein [Nitrososphaerota archaeon]
MSYEQLIKITSAGTISIPKDFRKFLELQKGDYVKVVMDDDRLVVKKATIT